RSPQGCGDRATRRRRGERSGHRGDRACAGCAQARRRNRARRIVTPKNPARDRHLGGAGGGAGMKRALLLLFLSACGKDNILDIGGVEPLGDNPLAEAASIRISAGTHTSTAPVTNGHYNLSFTLQTSNPAELVPVTVDAFAADGTTVVAHGATPTIQLAPATGRLYVYVA